MGGYALRNEEKIGLGAAVVLHGALVAVLLMQAVRTEVSVFPERMTVSLTSDVGLEAASPDPVAESRASTAPTLAPEPDPAPEPKPAQPERVERTPAPQPMPQPTRAARPTPMPSQPTLSRDRSRPDRTPAPRASSSPAPRPTSSAAPTRTAKSGGGSRIGDDFLEGRGSSTTTQETRAPASKLGATELASLRSAVGRLVKVKWQGRVPQGPDAELLVTRVRFKLNPDGTLAGEPQLVGDTSGVTDLNRNQVARHREEAIRAIKLVGQFNLPISVPPDQNTFTLVFDRNS